MLQGPSLISRRTVGEWQITSGTNYDNPFADVILDAVFSGPDGQTMTVPAFYDGGSTWRFRANLPTAGQWTITTHARPGDDELIGSASVEVVENDCRGFVQTCPGEAFGWQYESGEPIFWLGDTTYNLFSMAHSGGDVEGFIQRRAEQGHNLLRIRAQASPYHPPRGYSDWETRRSWPWGGSEQKPMLDQFNLDWFATVDQVVAQCEEAGVGIEFIMEAWGFEYPFNDRSVFLPEYEDMWMRYLIARYDAYNCLAIWDLMNEYEYYPDGDWRYNRVADLWAMRRGRWVKALAPHGHVVAVHNGPRVPAFADRFKLDPDAIDAIMFQDWGTRGEDDGWLAAGIEDTIAKAFDGWWGAAIFAEWGYEKDPTYEDKFPGHRFCCQEHSRRGAWRGAMMGYGIIAGWEHTWGPWMDLETDQPGLKDVMLCKKFFTDIVDFASLRPANELILGTDWPAGHKPIALASASRDVVVVYLPVGGSVALDASLPAEQMTARWYDPRTGNLSVATSQSGAYVAPDAEQNGHPCDWVLYIHR